MGFGGDLILTAVIRELGVRSGRPVRIAQTPQLTDLVQLRWSDRTFALSQRPIFQELPGVVGPATSRSKSAFAVRVDDLWRRLLQRTGLRAAFENLILQIERWRLQLGRSVTVYVDLEALSYGAKDLPDRIVWRTGGHAVDLALARWGLAPASHRGEIHFTNAEKERVQALVRERSLEPRTFAVVEPHTNAEWFGNLREWDFSRWQAVVNATTATSGQVQRWVQVGVPGPQALDGVTDVRGRLTFRETAYLISLSKLFVGTEGGLMHAARAVDAPAVILWGGLTPAELTGYAEHQTLVTHPVKCAPCGLKGECPYGRECMLGITVDQVRAAIERTLAPTFSKSR